MSPGTPSEPQATRAYVPPLLADQRVAVVARRGRRRRSPGTPGAILLVLVVIVLMGIGRLAEPAAHGRGEITLLPATAAGVHPFTASVATGHPAPPPATATATRGTAGGEASTASVITTTAASQPGLFGGSRSQASCDGPQLLSNLQAAPERTAAFAEVEGISAADLQSFVVGLTGVVLRGDTRVTEHGFITDHPSIYQALLQSGTAVLVDHFGVPRVRCVSGDPLTPPVAVAITPRYVGTHWQAFAPGAVTVVAAAARPITAFVLTDSGVGRRFSRPAGTDGRADRDAPATAPAN